VQLAAKQMRIAHARFKDAVLDAAQQWLNDTDKAAPDVAA
jgi:hypothetical protein